MRDGTAIHSVRPRTLRGEGRRMREPKHRLDADGSHAALGLSPARSGAGGCVAVCPSGCLASWPPGRLALLTLWLFVSEAHK